METSPSDEAEQLVDGIVDNGRREIIESHTDLIQKAVSQLSNFREFNTVVSEIRRRLQD
jgi:hypothetical protein